MEWPIRYTKSWSAVPLTGQQCWLRWTEEDVADDGPFVALCLLWRSESAEMTAEVERYHIERDGKRILHEDLGAPYILESAGDEAPEYMTKYVVLGTPGSWENDTYKLGDQNPEVWWHEPPPKEKGG